jgi:hypothetical protein
MKQKQINLILAIVLLSICKKVWIAFPKNYKGMAYASFINAFYYYLFKRHLLWEFNPGGDLSWRFLRKVHIFMVTPLLVLLCLSSFPRSYLKQVVHIIKWVAYSAFVEHYIAKNKMINYKYGWSLFWSTILYIQMYVFSYLYMKKPSLTWILTVCSIIFYILKFKVPFSKRLLKGPFFLFFNKKNIHFRLR